MRYTLRFSFVVAALVLIGCGGGSSSTPEPIEVRLTPVGNEMRYEQTEFTVSPGQTVTIIFENTATSEAMQHNVVVLNSNDDAVAQRVGMAGLAAAATGYVPEDEAILANTEMAKPGETTQVTFTAPTEPGTYRYICTFPGHFTLMQGNMIVQ